MKVLLLTTLIIIGSVLSSTQAFASSVCIVRHTGALYTNCDTGSRPKESYVDDLVVAKRLAELTAAGYKIVGVVGANDYTTWTLVK